MTPAPRVLGAGTPAPNVHFLTGAGGTVMRARLESPRLSYATPWPLPGTPRAPRQRQLPTNDGHAALPSPGIRPYQLESAATPPRRSVPRDPLRDAPLASGRTAEAAR